MIPVPTHHHAKRKKANRSSTLTAPIRGNEKSTLRRISGFLLCRYSRSREQASETHPTARGSASTGLETRQLLAAWSLHGGMDPSSVGLYMRPSRVPARCRRTRAAPRSRLRRAGTDNSWHDALAAFGANAAARNTHLHLAHQHGPLSRSTPFTNLPLRVASASCVPRG